jgi:hypothetical protein
VAKCPQAYLSARGDFPVSRIRNADDFLIEYRRIQADYDYKFKDIIADIREKYADGPSTSIVDQSLEAHLRAYKINALLAALNWRLDRTPVDDLPNLIPEAPVRSQDRKTIRFLDYLGLENESQEPILIVETKRPSAQLPYAEKPAATYSEVISQGLKDEPLSDDWNQWLKDLTDYFCSVFAKAQKITRRVVITNGDWIIIFLDPLDAFEENGHKNPNHILVFKDAKDINQRFNDLFRYLECQNVVGEATPITLEDMNFHIKPELIDRGMHGLKLHYIEEPGVYKPGPVIKVAPVVFLRTRYGNWVRVANPPYDYRLPDNSNNFQNHLEELEKAARQMLNDINFKLGVNLQPVTIANHYESEEDFGSIPGLVEFGEDEYLVVTGADTHFLLPQPSIDGCPYHDWAACKKAGVATKPGPRVERSISPRSFFMSGEIYHCAHSHVETGKASQINEMNQSSCGPRSGKNCQAFCEIWRFEQHLCCRACVFGDVCTNTIAFQLPC